MPSAAFAYRPASRSYPNDRPRYLPRPSARPLPATRVGPTPIDRLGSKSDGELSA
jgi:hypothetical protein